MSRVRSAPKYPSLTHSRSRVGATTYLFYARSSVLLLATQQPEVLYCAIRASACISSARRNVETAPNDISPGCANRPTAGLAGTFRKPIARFPYTPSPRGLVRCGVKYVSTSSAPSMGASVYHVYDFGRVHGPVQPESGQNRAGLYIVRPSSRIAERTDALSALCEQHNCRVNCLQTDSDVGGPRADS